MRTIWTLAGVCVGLATALTPDRAEACGGTFCDGGLPAPMPVDQTGENVIFVMGGAMAEVHIQISVDPNTSAQKFAWMIPLAAVPEFSVGSQPLFDQLRAATVPTYALTQSFETCAPVGDGGNFDETGGAATTTGESFSAGGSSGGEEPPPMPDVLLQETVGAFDVVVLQDTELAPIQMWLEMNGYNWDPNAAPILEQYIGEGNVLAALKLTTGAGLQDVHPITLTYPSLETCFPLRLTRIAAVEDMDIRVFVLGDDRAAPTNYRHVLVNPLKIDWLSQASNYKEVISNAVDAFMADGRAFVTEYAGTSGIVQQFGLYDPEWGDQVFIGLPPTSVISVLNSQGLSYCVSEFTCEWYHPLVYGLLLEFLPPPDGVDPIQFYPYLSDYAGQIDLVKWNDGADFAAAMLSRIIEPGQHATLLLETWPYLTRMYTTISPGEMMEDPIFHLNPDLADVDQFRQADNYNLCNGDSVTTLPDGREVYVPNGFSWPDIPGETWWEEEVQAVALKGAPMTLVNNTAAINKVLEAWNLAHGWPRGADSESGNVPTGDWWTGTGGLGPDGGIGNEPGCGCRSSEPRGLWLGLGLLGLRVRRRRRR